MNTKANSVQHWDETGHAWPKHKLNSDCNVKSL